jgi:hypothetical protein
LKHVWGRIVTKTTTPEKGPSPIALHFLTDISRCWRLSC